ncbi:MAG: tRNA pseudouridine(38-40) synthase TruA [Spirochaetaceae bacterium]|jgi:tRNA pseudouridine38-40 synthase|nr:tRNA pseudouridine(38-40) synthase TruA [Spirochaetaceae bacterium]
MTNGESHRNIQLIVAYDGTMFSGWQRQRNKRTIQGCIEAVLEKMHKKHILLNAAGRTDTGVHAVGQCVNFFTDIQRIPAANFVFALNSMLPQDIRIRAAREVPDDFHARFSAKSRTYRYHIICGIKNFPHKSRYSMQINRRLDIKLLQDYARLLRGEIDCSLFASPSDQIFQRGTGSKYRAIINSCFFVERETVIFEISANAFFRRMVRSIVGTLMYYEEKKIKADEFTEILKSGERSMAGPTAPSNGLFLWHIEY